MPMPELCQVNCSRGAPMGRIDQHNWPASEEPAKFFLQAMPMIDGAYDKGGAYWGCGSRETGWMYRAYSADFEDGVVEIFLRANSREAAKDLVIQDYPNATFYR